MAEFPELGKHCFVCKCLDYLPYPCQYCQHVFCKEHKSTDSHKCSQFEEILNKDSECASVSESSNCTFCSTKITLKAEAVTCGDCKQVFCLLHRHSEGHGCSGRQKVEIPDNKPRLGPVITSQTFKGCKGTKNDKLAQKVAVMKMKHTAKGVPSIPQEERVYLYVQFDSKEKPFYVSKEWSVGKCVDWLANQLGAECKSKQDQKLYLYKEDEALPYEMFVKELEKQNLIGSGDHIKLSYTTAV